ncbi:WD40-repeat-containing domain protein [Flagelloscypha sp. PMI_526]|nr:WD40-repeat-containing domain protein [Flagelloscypha sp. PMI_526]
MLGPLRMTTKEAKKAYLRIYNSKFLAKSQPSERAEILKHEVERLLDSHMEDADTSISTMQMADVRNLTPNCKFGVTAMASANLSKPIMFRAYQGRGSSVQSTLLEALLATLSDGQTLPPVPIGEDIPELFVSTAAGFCNPTESLLGETPSIFKSRDISVIVSIGSGRPDPAAISGQGDFAHAVLSLAMSCHTVAENMQSRFSRHLGLFVRLDVNGFDLSRTFQPGDVISHSRVYMDKEEIRERVDALIHSLTERPKRLAATQISGLKPGIIEEIKHAVEAISSGQDSHILERLNISKEAPFSSAVSKDVQRQSCTPGTRVAILRKLLDWATLYEPSLKLTLFWLYGLAGTGKTTILQDICETLQKRHLLASSYFCSIQLTSGDSRHLVPTIARQLATCAPAFGSTLASQLRKDPGLVSATLKLQFIHLLCKPWKEAAEAPASLLYRAVIVVIDALDECDRGEEFLDLLLDAINEGQLEGIRFIVSSRPVPHLLDKIWTMAPDAPQIALHQISKEEVDGDIQCYLRTKLKLTPSRLNDLVARADGLFIYASTLVKYLSPSQLLAPAELERRVEKILSREVEIGGINTLYQQVVDAAFSLGDNDDTKKRWTILHAIICAAEPPSAPVIAGLLSVELSLVHAVVRSLHSVLFTAGREGLIYIFHASFHDFVLSGMDGAFQFHPRSLHCTLAGACLTEMSASLRFNICHLESSFIPDAELVPPLEERAAEHIGVFLAYVSRNWWAHIAKCDEQGRAQLVPRIESMLQEKGIFWIETMSLLGDIRRCKEILIQVTSASAIVRRVPRIRALALDASNLVSRFESIPLKLTSHLYLSCLALSERTLNLNYWRARFQYLPQVMSQQRSGRRHCTVVINVKSRVKSVDFSPDGKLVVSSSDDTTIRIWDSESGKEVQQLKGHTDFVRSAAFSPNGMRIISGSLDKTIRIWDSHSGKEIRQLKGHTGHILSVAFSPDGTCIASGSGDKTIRVWDSESGKLIRGLDGHRDCILSVSFSPRGMHIVSGSIDKTIRIWNSQSGKELRQLKGHTSYIRSVAFSPDGMHIVSGSEDKTIRIWDSESGREVRQISSQIGSIQSIAFAPDGMRILSGSGNGTTRIWDAESGEEIRQLEGHKDYVRSAVFSPDGMRIVSGSDDQTICIWEADPCEELQQLNSHTGSLRSVDFCPDGIRIVSSSNDQTIRIWDSQSGREVRQLKGHRDFVRSAAFSPNGRQIISTGDRTIRIWDSELGRELRQLKANIGHHSFVAFSPDGMCIASGSDDATIHIWDSHSDKELLQLRGHQSSILSVAFSPDGMRIVSSSQDATIRIWDSHSGQELRKLNFQTSSMISVISVAFFPDRVRIASGREGDTIYIWDFHFDEKNEKIRVCHDIRSIRPVAIQSVAFFADGMRIVPSLDNQTFRIWDRESGKEFRQLDNYMSSPGSVALSPDEMRIVSVTVDQTVCIRDSKSGKEIRQIKCHSSSIQSVAFSPDRMRIVSGSRDGTTRIWDSESGKMLWQLNGHADSVNSVAFSPDGMRIVSGCGDKTIRVWDAQRYEMLPKAEVHKDGVLSVVFKQDIQRTKSAGHGTNLKTSL